MSLLEEGRRLYTVTQREEYCHHVCTQIYTQLPFSYCGRSGLKITDKHGPYAHMFRCTSSTPLSHLVLPLSGALIPRGLPAYPCPSISIPFHPASSLQVSRGSERINEHMHKLVNECVCPLYALMLPKRPVTGSPLNNFKFSFITCTLKWQQRYLAVKSQMVCNYNRD